MKVLNRKSGNRVIQAGFTIIELVVVILLLGILTATALPRFLDISDDAHGSVVNAVEGSLRSGLALYKAGFVARGKKTDVAMAAFGLNTMFPNSAGYPIGLTIGPIVAGEGQTRCTDVFNGLLDLGGIVVTGAVGPDLDAASETLIETAATGDFVITPDVAPASVPAGCHFYYTGQFASGDTTTVTTPRLLSYVFATGVISQSLANFELDTP